MSSTDDQVGNGFAERAYRHVAINSYGKRTASDWLILSAADESKLKRDVTKIALMQVQKPAHMRVKHKLESTDAESSAMIVRAVLERARRYAYNKPSL